ncbi:hypothetical protein HYH03_016567 [Edaphochlamys debaryana]|uniref:Glycosyltransferase n=1 Tax=Edaphochlamys debaryana TaxID=47281 RepID=A0A835XKS0_9CHLO|nr:hypothetical protein HYH03_016567 [Edaphochlamys debaryana]|eukprot:KAG2484613.1 hypothetical protein HYH03_016567 [Edaphochlamys debaryana]
MMCHMADILVFSDTIPDARPLIEGGCTTPLILLVTNRYDYGIEGPDYEAYTNIMKHAANQSHIWWVVNNPYESYYIRMRGVPLPEERLLQLRPAGVCLLPPASLNSPERPRVALVQPTGPEHLENTFIAPWIKEQGLTEFVRMYRQHYGGPTVLARHRGVLSVPYQTSVMKMYEGLTAGAVFIIPSPTFFVKLLGQHNNSMMVMCCRDLIERHPNDWRQYFDWYHEDFIQAHLMYDSWDELRDIIRDRERSMELIEERRYTGRLAMRRSRQRTLDGYSKLYRAVSQQACDGARKPDVLSQGYEPRG